MSDLIRKGKNGIFYLSFSVAGVRIRESTRTADPKLATEMARSRYSEVYREGVIGTKPGRTLCLKEAAHRFWCEVASHTDYGQNSQQYQLKKVVSFWGESRSLGSITGGDIAIFLQSLRADGAGPATCNRYLSLLSAIRDRAQSVWNVKTAGWKVSDHWQKEPPPRAVYLTKDQASGFIRTVIPHARGPISLALFTGLRQQNVLQLQWHQINIRSGRIGVVQKGGRQHGVDLVPPAIKLLERQEPDEGRRSGAVFWVGNPAVECPCAWCRRHCDRNRTFTNLAAAFDNARKAIGMPDLRFHDLRHTVASWLVQDGVPLQAIQEILGHTRIEMSARYAHLAPGQRLQHMAGTLNWPDHGPRSGDLCDE